MKTLYLTALTLALAGQLALPLPAFGFDLGGIAKDLLGTKEKSTSQLSDDDYLKMGLDVFSTLTNEVSDEEEDAIGREIAGRLLGAAPLVNDPKLQAYVNKVGKWVTLQTERPERQWTFGVLESDTVNAFASPGGYIFVTRGLYRRLNNESELAGVLGHEIGHVIRGHHLKVLNQSKLLDTGSKILTDNIDNRTQIVDNLIGNGAEILSRGLDKDAEFEADLIGVVLSGRAGYDSYGLPLVLQELGHATGNAATTSLLFKTHPHPNDRLDHIDLYSSAIHEGGKVVEDRFYRID
jgi:predicted Zn-dependent protease